MPETLRWGILSTANIGVKTVVPAIQRAEGCEVVALASRDQAKAQEISSTLSIPKAYDSYEALLADAEIDAVYNPLPNSLHREWSEKALRAGKHVLCEKPLGLSAAEAVEMAEVAEGSGRTLMEAFMYRFHPRFEKLKELLTGGAIGELRLLSSAFTFHVKDAANIRLDPELGGGALYDVGCYCVNIIRTLAGEEPTQVTAQAHWTERGVDDTLVGTLRLGNVLAHFDCSLSMTSQAFVRLLGTEGVLEATSPFVVGSGPVPITEKHEGQEDIVHTVPGADEYQLMAEHFADCVLHGKPLKYPVSDAIANMRVMDALYKAAKVAAGNPRGM
jgi:predicted dehydrogenase